MQVIQIDPRDCTRWLYADRSNFEFGNTDALAQDIKQNGQINPIFVRKIHDNPKFKYEVIAGSRRLRACLNANLMIDAIIIDVNDDKAALIQLKENDKLPLSEFSKSIAFAKLKKDKKLTQEQLAQIAGYSRKKIFSLLSFAKVDQKIWDAVGNMSKVSAKSSETILYISKKSQEHKDALIEIADEIKKGAGHRRIERMVAQIISGKSKSVEPELILSTSGQSIAQWNDNKLVFTKDLQIDKNKLNAILIDFFEKS
jgi:ParB family transcriptional regulator, chromosome partitioning protein